MVVERDDVDLVVALAVRRLRALGVDGAEAERQGIAIPNDLAVLTDGELDAWIAWLRRGEGN